MSSFRQLLLLLLAADLVAANIVFRGRSLGVSSSSGAAASSIFRVSVASHPFPSVSLSSYRSISHSQLKILLSLRGGAAKSPSKKKKASSSSSSSAAATSSSTTITATDNNDATKATTKENPDADETKTSKAEKAIDEANAKKVIAEALHEKDAAEALGDAIRDRADLLRADFEKYNSPLLQSIEQSVSSVGHALGTSDRPNTKRKRRSNKQGKRATVDDDAEEEEDESGGVEVAPQSVLAHYFLKSHGGAHALQSACSVLSVVSGIGALILPTAAANKDDVKLVLLRRSLLLAMTKHVAGLLAATSTAAAAIPQLGLSKSRLLLERLALDPVSQYLFYSALILVWLPQSLSGGKGAASVPWWWRQLPFVPVLLLGPILLREIVSTVLVASDVLVLWTTTANQGREPRLLRMGQAVVDAFMSLLVTPQIWRNATPSSRQAILAKLVSRTSLAVEVLVGVLFLVDVAMAWVAALFTTQAPSFRERIVHLICLRLYGRFLLVRRRKIGRLAKTIRGGAHHVPVRVLDALLDPRTAMGLETTTTTTKEAVVVSTTTANNNPSWLDFVMMALGLDEK